VVNVPSEALANQSGSFISIRPEWLATLVKRARGENLSIVVIHSHPFSNASVAFSAIDTFGQSELAPKLKARVPNRPHAELVFGQGSIDGLVWPAGSTQPVPLDEMRVIGRALRSFPATGSNHDDGDPPISSAYDRQVLIWGKMGQRRLKELKVGVVGAGGNGSLVAIHLVHMGVGTLVVVDQDVVEDSNRSRIIGSLAQDVTARTPKVEVLSRYAARHNPDVKVLPIFGSVLVPEVARQLSDCDLVVGCTDTLASRAVLNQLSVQYHVPLLDTGVEVEIHDKGLRSFAARAALIRPGTPCLECMNYVTREAVQLELRAEQRPGYVPGVASPSVMPLNALAASLASVEFIRFVHDLVGGVPMDSYVAFSARSGEARRCSFGTGGCSTCAQRRGRGDNLPFPDVDAYMRAAESSPSMP
jgi:molybdopterin/thiamine biosynthesis adenylyltransferase